MVIENYFSIYLIIDLVQVNKHLRKMRIKRKTFQQSMILSDTLYLEEIDVKFCCSETTNGKWSSLVLGQNLSLHTIRANCFIDMNSQLPQLTRIVYSSGYRPQDIVECDKFARITMLEKAINGERQSDIH